MRPSGPTMCRGQDGDSPCPLTPSKIVRRLSATPTTSATTTGHRYGAPPGIVVSRGGPLFDKSPSSCSLGDRHRYRRERSRGHRVPMQIQGEMTRIGGARPRRRGKGRNLSADGLALPDNQKARRRHLEHGISRGGTRRGTATDPRSSSRIRPTGIRRRASAPLGWRPNRNTPARRW